MKQYRVEVLQDEGGEEPNIYTVMASTPDDACLIAFALDGGFAGDRELDEGHLQLALSYAAVI